MSRSTAGLNFSSGPRRNPRWHFHSRFEPLGRKNLDKWQIGNVRRRRVCVFVVWQTPRRLVVGCHSHILCSRCGASLLTLTSYTLNNVSVRRRTVPWWFALMSQSISSCPPTGTSHRVARRNQTPSSYTSNPIAPRGSFSLNITNSDVYLCCWVCGSNQTGLGAVESSGKQNIVWSVLKILFVLKYYVSICSWNNLCG